MYFDAKNQASIAQGVLQGTATQTPGVTAFLGVPFAVPPVGALRWVPPQPPQSWQGVRPAVAYGKVVPQYDLPWGSFYQKEFYPTKKVWDEDGLFLNVWSNAPAPDAKQPVFVWIHGGAFVEGGGSALQFIGEGLAALGVVVVTINYRLGALGFLAHPALTAEAGASGNYAFLDQIRALEWVQENIAAFGGDPDRVTVGGQSAGSMSVNALLVSPAAKGLFRGAVMQSSSALLRPTAGTTLAQAEETGLRFQKTLGVSSLAEMRALSAERILDVGEHWGERFYPLVDGAVVPAQGYLAVLRAARQNKVALLAGACDGEDTLHTLNEKDYETYCAMAAAYGPLEAEFRAAFPAVDNETASAQMNPIRSAGALVGMRALAAYQHAAGCPAYLYCFDHRLPDENGTTIGAFHSSELVYEFGTLDTGWRPWREEDYALSRRMMRYLANFCAQGDPNGEDLPQWNAFAPAAREVMRLNPKGGMGPLPFDAQMAFLEKVLERA